MLVNLAHSLFNMPFFLAIFATVGLSVIATSILLLAVRYISKHIPHLREQSARSVMELSLTIVGTLVAVVIAFILLVVWTRFEQAKTICDQEASEATVIYHLSGALEARQKSEFRHNFREYVNNIITEEWKDMSGGTFSDASGSDKPKSDVGTLNQFWKSVTSSLEKDKAMDKMLDHIATMSNLRSQRLFMSRTKLPSQIWGVLIICTVIMTIAVCIVWVDRFVLHFFNATLLAGVVTLVLTTTYEIDNPFQGEVSVKPVGLIALRVQMDNDNAIASKAATTLPSTSGHSR